MDELKVVGMEYKVLKMSPEKKLDYLVSKNIDKEEIEDIRKNHNRFKNYEFPNRIIKIALENTFPYKFSEDVVIRSIETILSGKLRITGKIDVITGGEQVNSTRTIYYAKMIWNQKEMGKNRKIMSQNLSKEIILIKEFTAITRYGKVIDSILHRQILNEIPTTDDWHIVTSLIDTDANRAYLCFSSDLANEIKKRLYEDEYISLPQIDFSDYANELDNIIRDSLFRVICHGEYLSTLMDALHRFRGNDYSAFSKTYEIIELILRNIVTNLGDQASKMGEALDILAGNSSHRRLFNETECLIIAIGRNIQAHARHNRTRWDEKYLTILSMKAIRDIFLDWRFFEAFFKCLDVLSQENGKTSDDLWKIYEKDVKSRRKEDVNYSGEWNKNMRFEIKYRDGKYISDYIFDVSPGGEDVNLIETRRVGL